MSRVEDICAIPTGLIGFKKTARDELQKLYEAEGLKYYQPQLGGSPSEIIVQAVAWLDIHPFVGGLAGSLVFEAAKQVMGLFRVARAWYAKHPPNKIENLTVKNVVIFNINYESQPTHIEMNLTKDYPTPEVIEMIKSAVDQIDVQERSGQ